MIGMAIIKESKWALNSIAPCKKSMKSNMAYRSYLSPALSSNTFPSEISTPEMLQIVQCLEIQHYSNSQALEHVLPCLGVCYQHLPLHSPIILSAFLHFSAKLCLPAPFSLECLCCYTHLPSTVLLHVTPWNQEPCFVHVAIPKP